MLHSHTFIMLMAAWLVCESAWSQSVEETESEKVAAASKPNAGSQSVDPAAVARRIVEQTNEFRAAHDRSQVEVNPRLAEAARYFASYMGKHDTYGHHADGNRPSQRATKYGYEYCLISENIAYQYDSTGFATAELAEQFVEGWKESPKHRENMLDDDVVETGVAVARSEDTGYWYAVQMFGRPESATIEFKIANRSNTTVNYSVRDKSFPLPPGYTRTHVRCRETAVDFGIPADGEQAGTIQPQDGDSFTVARQNDRLTVTRE